VSAVSTVRENRLPDLLEGLQASVFLVGADTGEILDVNRATCERLGYDREELVGKSPSFLSETFPETTRWDNHVEEVKKQGNLTVHTQHYRKDGSAVPVLVNVEYVEDADGDYILAIARETDRAQSSQPTYYTSESRYSSLFEHAPNALWEEDCSALLDRLRELDESVEEDLDTYLDSHPELIEELTELIQVVRVNQPALDLYGASSPEQLIEHFKETIAKNHRDLLKKQYLALHTGRRELEETARTTTVEGETIDVRIKLVVPEAQRDSLSQVFVSVVDISDLANTRRELARRETYLQTLVDNVPGVTYRCEYDEQWTMEFMSGAVEELTGYPPEGFIENRERSYASVIHPEDRDHVREVITEAVENQEPFEIDYRIRRADGEVRWVFERGQAIFEQDGSVTCLSGVILDHTERTSAVNELEEREELLDSLVSSVPGIVYREEIDPDGNVGSMRYISESCREIIGYDPEEFTGDGGRNFHDVIHEEDRQRVLETLEETVRTGEDFEMEFRVRCDDGSVKWISERGELIHDEDSDVTHLHGVMVDVTDRKRAENQLRRSEQRFRSTFEQAAVGIAHVATDGSFLRVNRTFCDMLGYDEDELLELDFQTLTHPDDLDRDLEYVDKLREGEEETYSIEKRYFRKDGSVIWVRLTVGIVRSDTEDDYFVSVIEDITERKETERALEKSDRGLREFYRITTNPGLDFQQRIDRVLDLGREQFDMDTGIFTRIHDDGITLDRVRGNHEEEFRGETLEMEQAYCRETVDQEGVNVIHDAINEGWEGEAPFEKTPFDSYIGAKIYVNDGVYGTLCFEGEEPISDRFIDNKRNFVRIMAQWIGFEIQRRRTKTQLEESERRFREMAENIEEVFWLTSPDKERMLYVSPAYEKIWGRSTEALYEDPDQFLEAIHPDDRERVEEAIPRQAEGNYDIQYRIRRPDGEIRWIHDRAFPVEDENGSVVRIAGVAEDITEEKQVQRERDRVFETSQDMICVVNYDGQFIDLNPAFTEVLGYDRDTLRDQPFMEFVHEEDREKTREAMEQLRDGEDLSGFENRYLTREGEIRWFQWNVTPGENRIYAVARDITRQREYRDQLEQTLEEKNVLLDEVHHRVKNNLQVVSSLLDMQAREIDSEEFVEPFRDSVARIRTMAMIHEKLYQSDSLDEIDMDEYLRDLISYLRRSQGHENIELVMELDPVSLSVGQSISLGMIVNELVSNAFQHAFEDDESGTITVSFEAEDGTARLMVRDNGKGLPPDVDLESASSVGMKVVRSIVNYDLDGGMTIEGEDGVCVTVEIPLESNS
jgi:PAS domain S-box-containing protein